MQKVDADWLYQTVAVVVHEAYDSFIASGGIPELTQSGKYLIKTSTKEGIRLEIFITKKGIIKTVYPKW